MHSQYNRGDRIALLRDIRIGAMFAAAILAMMLLVTARAHDGSRQAASGNPTSRAERLSGVRALQPAWRPYDMTGSSAFEEVYRDSGEPHYDRIADTQSRN